MGMDGVNRPGWRNQRPNGIVVEPSPRMLGYQRDWDKHWANKKSRPLEEQRNESILILAQPQRKRKPEREMVHKP